MSTSTPWPELRVAAWRDTYATLLLYRQIVGKIRLALAPKMNQWWNVPLYVTARGLTTSPMPYGDRLLRSTSTSSITRCVIQDSDGHVRALPLVPQPVCDFYADAHGRARRLDVARPHLAAAAGVSGDHAVHRRPRARALRSRRRADVLAGAAPHRAGVPAVPRALPRQVQPGALLLGRLRPRGHPLRRPPRAASARRRSIATPTTRR